jgi:ketosteroid isomerase-like protein
VTWRTPVRVVLSADDYTSCLHFSLSAARTISSRTGKSEVSAEREVRDALARFIYVFDNLDWEAFRLAFDDNATVFYPRAFPERANGRAEFERTFKAVFQQIRDGKTAAPYMDIQPKDMKVQMFGDCAIATFHLDERPGLLNRRTIVLTKTNAGWKIVHLHASEVSATTRQR